MRREAARFALSSMAQAIATAPPSRWRRETRRDHLQNGVAALLNVGSEVAWRPRALAVFFATRARARAELRYALAELHRAARPERRNWETRRLLLATIPSAAAALGLVAARMHDRPRRSD